MIPNLPIYISILFVLTTICTLVLFVRIINTSPLLKEKKRIQLISNCLVLWLLLQSILSLGNIYNSDTNSLPPKIVLFGVMPALILVLLLFLTKSGRHFIDGLSLKKLTYLHVVRIPIELVLYFLFLEKAIPELMTFTGRNFDILAGLSAPIVAYFAFTKKLWTTKVVLVWNFISLGLLINIVVHALLSAPSPFQQFAFDQPNVAILYFPFSWLPTFIVPVVLFCHLATIRQIIVNKESK